jgi:hypothetical protein
MDKEKHYKLKFKKIIATNQLASGDNVFDWTVEQLQHDGVDVDSYMTGAEYEVINSNIDDEIKFQLVDSLDVLIYEFADIAAINGVHLFEQYLSYLPQGTKLRVIYKKTGASDCCLKVNLIRHIETKAAR